MNKIFLPLLCIIPLLFLSACSDNELTPEDQIKLTIDQIELAVEQRSVTQVSEYLSVKYKDKRHRSRQQVIGTLLGYFHRNKNIHLFTRIRSIDINAEDQEQAKASLNVAMTGTQISSPESLMTIKADVFRFDITLVFEDNWVVTSAEWQRISPRQFID